MAQIFLCHASEDKTKVREVYQRLLAIEGLKPWLDEEDILPGQVWEDEIPRALKASDFILIFLSQNSVAKRGYVQREMRLALDALQEVSEGTIHTIPVRLDDCDVPEQFQRYQYANLFDERGFERIVQAIRFELSQRQPPEPETTAEPTWPQTLTNSIDMEFILIPAGEFLMGSNDGDNDEKPVHKVTISEPFYLGKYQVTQAQWEALMGNNPSYFKGDSNRPVEKISWNDAQEFIRKLNEKEGSSKYRLPTEAEWEYACRAGTTTAYSLGDDPRQLGEYAWYDENSKGETHPVGQLRPNA
jgi:formylglycine-generating enzyme required for sulfatase activity